MRGEQYRGERVTALALKAGDIFTVTGRFQRYAKEYDLDPRQSVVRIDRFYLAEYPLAGHAGNCERVCHATVSGKTDAPCSCGATSK